MAVTLNISVIAAGDAYLGDPQMALMVNGQQIGTATVTASHGSGQWQTLTFSAAMPTSFQTIGVSFLNDAYGGAPTLDRNLYVDHIVVNGTTLNPQQGVFQDPWDPASTGSSALYNQGTLTWNAALLGSPTEQPITAANQTAQTDAAHAVTVNLLANAIDPNPGETLTVTGIDLTGTKGSVVLNSDGTATETPGAAFATLARGQTATDVFHYTISNGHGQTSTATETVTIAGIEQPITAANQTTQTDAAHAVTVNLLANAIDPNLGDTLTVTSVDLTGTKGSVVLNSNGTAVYTPGSAFANLGPGQIVNDVFHYTISDGHGSTSTATETVAVGTVPTLHNLNVTVIAAGDAYLGDPQMALVVNGQQIGTATVTASHGSGQWQTLTFSAAMPANFQTIGVSFLNDAYGGAPTLDRNLYVDHIVVNGSTLNPQQGVFQDPWDPPSTGSTALYNAGTLTWNAAALLGNPTEEPITAANQTAQTDAAHAVTVNLLANAFDPNPGETLAVSSIDLTGTKGTVVLNGDGTATETPGAAFAMLARGHTATDLFHYTISNGHGQTSAAAATVTIAGIEQPITAANQAAQTDAAHAVTVDLLANAIDPNLGDTLTVTGVDLTGTKGSVVLNSDGTASYTPGSAFGNLASGQSATDAFHYTISDGHGSTSTATDTVTVTGTATTPASGFYVSTAGSDSNDGSFAHPFASLAQAQSAMQHSSVKTTYVEGGDYYLHNTLNLTAADNGESFLAYQGQTATVHGGQSLSGWTQGANGVWTTHVPAGLFDSGANGNLDVGGVLQTAARFPDAVLTNPIEGGWLYAAASLSGQDTHSTFQFNPGDVPHFSNTSGVYVDIYGQHGWESYLEPVTSIDYNTNTVHLGGSNWDTFNNGSRYFFFNAADQLNAPGEWYYDPAAPTISYKPSDPNWNGGNAVAANLTKVFAVTGASNVTLGGLTIDGSTNNGVGVDVVNSSNITLEGNHIHSTDTGVHLSGSTQVQIHGNEISNTVGNAITLESGSNYNTVAGNSIHDIGSLQAYSSGIFFTGSSNNDFAHNSIANVSKFGIGGGSNLGKTDASYNDVIEYNTIDHANLASSDGGGIYLIGTQGDVTGDIIRYNSVSNVTAAGTTSWDGTAGNVFLDPISKLVSFGIYLDDFPSGGVQIYGNLLNHDISGINIHLGWSNTVTNNIVVNGSYEGLSLAAPNWSPPANVPNPQNVFSDNIIVANNPTSIASVSGGSLTAATWDHNLYSGSQMNAAPFHIWGTSAPDYNTMAQWQSQGFDLHSQIADPLFVDAAHGNFALAANSPAHAFGFQDLPTADMGLPGYHAISSFDLFGH